MSLLSEVYRWLVSSFVMRGVDSHVVPVATMETVHIEGTTFTIVKPKAVQIANGRVVETVDFGRTYMVNDVAVTVHEFNIQLEKLLARI